MDTESQSTQNALELYKYLGDCVRDFLQKKQAEQTVKGEGDLDFMARDFYNAIFSFAATELTHTAVNRFNGEFKKHHIRDHLNDFTAIFRKLVENEFNSIIASRESRTTENISEVQH